MTLINYLLLIIATLVGLSIGSFINVIVYRLPLMLQAMYESEYLEFANQSLTPLPQSKPQKFNLCFPHSHCPNCKNNIPWWLNIPLLSFILLRGHCQKCKKPISWRYPITEAICSIVTVYLVMRYGINWQTLIILLFTWILLALISMDIACYLLPDQITLNLLWAGLLVNISTYHLISPEDAIIGAIVGYLSLWLIAKTFQLLRGYTGMGHGDFKLFAALGAWLGWQPLPLTLSLACLTGVTFGVTMILWKKQTLEQPIPFGPHLALAGWVMLLWGHYLTKFFAF